MIELNNREISILLWSGSLFLVAMRSADVRKSTNQVLGAICQRPLLIALGLSSAYVTVCVMTLHSIGFWEWNNLKATLVWSVTFAFVTMGEVVQSKDRTKSLKSIAKDTVSAIALVLFIGEFYVLPLWAELVLVPTLTLVGVMLVAAQHQPKNAIVIKPLSFIQIALGLSIIGYSAYRVVLDFTSFATMDSVRDFGTPILLSIMFLPFLYGLIIYSTYEDAANRMHFLVKDNKLRRYAFWRAALSFGLDLDLFKRFVRDLQNIDTQNRTTVRRTISKLHELKQRELNPPPVSWSDGWSPYHAREFLTDQDLLTNDYHQSMDGWWAESSIHNIGDGVLQDYLSYRIFGSESAVTLLKLVLNVNQPSTSDKSDKLFWDTVNLLVSRAVDKDTAALFEQECAYRFEATIRTDSITITGDHNKWGDAQYGGYDRQVEIRHTAHVDNY